MKRVRRTDNIIGMKFEQLTVIGIDTNCTNKKSKRAICLCTCGAQKSISIGNLFSGHAKSCGCLRARTCLSNMPEKYRETTHGISKSGLYYVWQGIVQRCENSKNQAFQNYGARGISVCDEWKNHSDVFIEWAYQSGYKRGLTLDRIDVNGNYTPDNCRWATRKEQVRNRRITMFAEIEGITRPVAEWCEIYGIKYQVVATRIKKGVPAQIALTAPLRRGVKLCGT